MTEPLPMYVGWVQPRRGTLAQKAVSTVVPLMGERVYVVDGNGPGVSGRWLTGDGVTTIADLEFDDAATSQIADVQGLTAALAGKQPLAGTLTSLAALTTTPFGRALLEKFDGGAVRDAIGSPPVNHSHDIGDFDTTGTPSDSTFLRGDGVWASPAETLGAMTADVYDPNSVVGDVFDQDNMLDGTVNKNFTAAEKTRLADAVVRSDTSTAGVGFVVDEDNMASDSATKVPTQQSVKAYADGLIASLIGAAPTELDTWIELVGAIEDNQSALDGITTSLSGKQPLDATLSALAAVATAANKLVYSDGADSFATTDLTAFGRTVVGYADAAAMRAGVDLEPGVDVQAYDADLDAIAALTTTSFGRGLLVLANAAALASAAGLGNVNNTADAAKAVLSATKLTTPRTINGTSFDGSANVVLAPQTVAVTAQAAPSIALTSPYAILSDSGLTAAVTGVTATGAADGYRLLLRFKDNGTSRAITLGASFRAMGVTVPTATTASKWLQLGCIYNSVDSIWDVVAVAVQA